MSSEFGNYFVTISDDDGNEYELEHLSTAEMNGILYMAFLPADVKEDDDGYGMVILKVKTEGGEDILLTVDDEDELNSAYELFVQQLSDEDEG